MRLSPSRPALALLCLAWLSGPASLPAQSFSTSREINFYRDVPSRSLKGLAARSDGALVSGPQLSPLVELPDDADLLWSAAELSHQLFVGTGPDGRLLSYRFSSTVDGQAQLIPAETLTLAHDSHLLALAALPDGSLLIGSSPEGALSLIREGELIARSVLPVTSILAIDVQASAPTPGPKAARGSAAENTNAETPSVLIATGGPARIYKVDLAKFRAAGLGIGKLPEGDEAALAERGFTLWGSVRDENLRSLLRLADGRVIAGSAPRGNVYEFAATGGAARVLAENTNAEITSLLAWEGGFYAALTSGDRQRSSRLSRSSSSQADATLRPSGPPADSSGDSRRESGDKNEEEGGSSGSSSSGKKESSADEPEPVSSAPKFSGSSRLLWFPNNGFPQTVFSRQGIGFYQLARHGGLVLISAGDEGELLGYDPQLRRNLLFAGARSSQVNALLPLSKTVWAEGDFLLMGNNPASIERMHWCPDWTADGEHGFSAQTRRIDLGTPAELGALRFAQLSATAATGFKVELRSSYSSDPLEGWGPWQIAQRDSGDPAWRATERGSANPASEASGVAEAAHKAQPLRGRYVQIRLSTEEPDFEASGARLYSLPQNQQPQLSSFTVLPPSNVRNGADTLRRAAEAAKISYRDDLAAAADTPLYRSTRVIIWDLSDANGDALLSTLSILPPERDAAWLPLLVDSENRFAVFDTARLPEGRYRSRLDVREAAPRPLEQRHRISFQTDDFVIDRTPPEIVAAAIAHDAANGSTHITVQARDTLSLLRGAEFHLNNGTRYEVSQPLDGILDGHSESFALELNAAQIGQATAVDIIVLDEHFNSSSTRLALP